MRIGHGVIGNINKMNYTAVTDVTQPGVASMMKSDRDKRREMA